MTITHLHPIQRGILLERINDHVRAARAAYRGAIAAASWGSSPYTAYRAHLYAIRLGVQVRALGLTPHQTQGED